MSKPTATPETSATETNAAPSSMFAKLKIVGIVAAIMIVELVGVLMLVPRSSAESHNTADHAVLDEHDAEHGDAHAHAPAAPPAHGAKEAKGHGKKDDHAPAAPVKSGTATEEVDLGEFSVTSYQPAASTTLFISFHLYGTLQHKNNEELSRRLDDNKHRIRDNIIVIVRSAEITDLTDAGLGLIKRRILETTNKTLGKPLLQAVVFSDFSFIEQ